MFKLLLGVVFIVVIGITVKVFLFSNVLGLSTSNLKSSYSIAIIGDSMVDTMGEQLEYLQVSLRKRYPNTTFYYYNYGIGSQNVEDGLKRIHLPFKNQTRSYIPLSELKPDILIVGSFAYNPFFPYYRDKHWLTLQKLVEEAKKISPKVYMLAEIAPLRADFGEGPNGVNWKEEISAEHSRHILEQLENAIYLSRDHLKVPLINAYSLSRADGKFGSPRYVDSNDGIHPSMAGHRLTAEAIAATIDLR